MARATDRFIAEIQQSHTVIAYVDVTSPTQETERLVVTDGDINVDRTAQFRRGGALTCLDPLGIFTPDGTTGILTPYGTEVYPYRGVRYSDGTEEVYPLGVFRLSKATISEAGSANISTGSAQQGTGVSIALEMFDRSRVISRDKFTNTYTIPDGTNVVTAIQLLVARTFPGVTYDAISTTINIVGPNVYNSGDDPWVAVTALGSSIGCDVYFDVTGNVVIAPPPNIASLPNPAFTYIEGQGCTMLSLSSIYVDDPGYNGVIVVGSSTSNELPPVRGEAWDMDPTSPTYRYGPYGQVPYFLNDTTITDAASALAAADSLLQGILGFTSMLSIVATPNPSLEAGDVVEVDRGRMNISGLFSLQSFDVPMLASETQTLTALQQRTQS